MVVVSRGELLFKGTRVHGQTMQMLNIFLLHRLKLLTVHPMRHSFSQREFGWAPILLRLVRVGTINLRYASIEVLCFV